MVVKNMIRKISWQKGDKELFVDYDEDRNEFTVIRNFYCYDPTTFERKVCNTDSVLNVGSYQNQTKFNKDTIDLYLQQAFGNYLPYFDDELGFIEDYDQLQSLKDQLDPAKFAMISQYPRIQQKEINTDPNTAKIVYSARCIVDADGNLEVQEIYVDHTDKSFMNSDAVPTVDIRSVLPTHVADSIIALREQDLLARSENQS